MTDTDHSESAEVTVLIEAFGFFATAYRAAIDARLQRFRP